MLPSFNLLDEPWLPVRLKSGDALRVGLKELFQRSSEISLLAETAPPSLVAEYRLLLAILHRALTQAFPEGWKPRDRARWYREGLPVDAICDYLEKWRERFWLFHPEYPFMQVVALATAKNNKGKRLEPKPWMQVALECSVGNTPVLFDHSYETAGRLISPAEAAAYLLGYLQFVPGGFASKFFRPSDKEGPLTDSVAFISYGETLAETLLLNLHPSGEERDLPAWEKDAPTVNGLCGTPTLATGPNDRYTRQTRSVLFQPEKEGYIRGLYFAEGLALYEDQNAPDPMLSYRKIKRKGEDAVVRLKLSEGRAIWRDLPIFSSQSAGGKGMCASVLNWTLRLHEEREEGVEELYQPILVAGLASDKATLARWRSERVVLPLSIIKDSDKHRTLTDLVEKSEMIYNDMSHLSDELFTDAIRYPLHKETNKKSKEIFYSNLFGTDYFSLLERSLPQFMECLRSGDLDEAEALWDCSLREAAKHAWDRLKISLGLSSAALRSIAKNEFEFNKLLAKYCPKPKSTE